MIRLKLHGTKRTKRRLSDLRARYQREVGDALLASAAEMNGHAIVEIQTNSGSGKTYSRGRRQHIASAPGEYPNTDYGELVRGMFARMKGRLTAVWGNSAKHAAPLELGTSRMAARPFMRPTYMKLKNKAAKRVADAIRKAVKEATRGR